MARNSNTALRNDQPKADVWMNIALPGHEGVKQIIGKPLYFDGEHLSATEEQINADIMAVIMNPDGTVNEKGLEIIRKNITVTATIPGSGGGLKLA